MLIKVSFPCNLFTLGKINIKNNGLYGCHSIKDCCYCVHSALVVMPNYGMYTFLFFYKGKC